MNSFLNDIAECYETYQEELIKGVASRFGLEEQEVRDCVNKITGRKVATKKSSSPQVRSSETCCGVLKKGGACVKKASSEVEGKWYCGVHRPDKPTKTSTKTELKPAPKKKSSNIDEKLLPAKKGNIKDNKVATQKRLESLMKKKVVAKEIRMIKVGGRCIDEKTRILFDGNMVYGKLDEDDETILPLEEEDIQIIDRWGVEIKSIPVNLEHTSDDSDAETNGPEDQDSGEDTEVDDTLEQEFETRTAMAKMTIVDEADQGEEFVEF